MEINSVFIDFALFSVDENFVLTGVFRGYFISVCVLDTRENNNVCSFNAPNANYEIKDYSYGTLTIEKKWLSIIPYRLSFGLFSQTFIMLSLNSRVSLSLPKRPAADSSP